jgi:hypothetical protein
MCLFVRIFHSLLAFGNVAGSGILLKMYFRWCAVRFGNFAEDPQQSLLTILSEAIVQKHFLKTLQKVRSNLSATLPKGYRPQAVLGSGDFPCKWRFDIKMRCLRPHRSQR